ncbi:hypothetical protein G3T14_15695 [Methylobacterium sp. BTF04]|uniref:hypothetical protein n=1 Tax=Methylobacterium sp. BTF04 TaxID=2708300 RepID=UPI0013CF5F01|nr:hypothetical protein [Methylobacterium sp. BTF04]NEU13563.1 hypothetical protein [Methylobacterium sp. BTF04]
MTTEEDLFDVELDGIERTLGPALGDTAYDVMFDCMRASTIVHITVSLNAEAVTTTEIVPLAMSELHRAFAALADQTKAWRIDPG